MRAWPSGLVMLKNDNSSIYSRVLLAALIAVSSFAAGLAQTSGSYEEAKARSRSVIADSMKKQNIPGFSAAVAVDGNIVWSEGFGFADLENRVAVTPATRFRIASVSKLFTTAAMARAHDQGKLDMDTVVQRYVPNFPRKELDITVRQLAGHLSGIRHYRRDPDEAKDEFFNRKEYYKSVTDGLKVFQNDPLDFPPGTKYGYSSFGYTLLSAAIEGATGQDFLGYVREQVFEPLKMRSSSADDNRKIIPDRTRFYSLDANKKLINAPYIDRSYSWAGGGFLSNAEDLVRFGSAHLSDGFICAETRRQMFTSQRTGDGKEMGVGLGWRIRKDKEGRLVYFHPGENVGGRSYLVAYPEKKVVIAMLHNLTGANLASFLEISELFLRETP